MKIPKQILIGTKCEAKRHEIVDILGDLPCKLLTPEDVGEMPEVVEDGSTFEQNACKKACELARHFRLAVLADDSGLEVDALDGRPGVLSHRYEGEGATDEENNLKLLAELEGVPEEKRTARYRCVVALATTRGLQMTADGVCEGRIALEPQGTNGFGYDPLFYYSPYGTTFGMADLSLKNQVSHRAQAVRKLRERLLKNR
ncbi:MAG TPA: RdgB/HAM1 family non-canonical purine NTP pyrophosphatase [Planctomycetota bacterium]|nr:RdgB/HAM1 family non-canonical purine NTP pyrophosphatase [Planctomycetota bacterium]